MKQDNARPWWKGLLILLSGPAILLILVFAVFERGSERSAEPWDEQVSDTFVYYVDYYLIPVARAAHPSCNETSSLADVTESCGPFIEALTEREDELSQAADQFETLAAKTPSDAPAELGQALHDTAGVLRLMREADLLLVAGWSEQDEGKWESGWRQKREARDSLKNLSEKLNSREAS